VHLTGSSACILALVAARLTTLGFVFETFFSIELLLSCRENELFTAVLAY
jgi:hypothetical protein